MQHPMSGGGAQGRPLKTLNLNKAKRWLALAGLVVVSLPVAALVPGCGGSGNGVQVTGSGVQLFKGDYSGTVRLSNGQTAVLRLNVEKSGQTTGTLTINDGTGVLTTVQISGQVNETLGTFSLNGSFTQNNQPQTATIRGTLPISKDNSGTFSVQIGANTFVGTIAVGLAPTPTPVPPTPVHPTPVP